MILAQRNFLPLFIAQILGVFNDNVFKSALTMLVTYRLAAETGANAAVLVSLGGGVFMLPYVLFSGLAGQVADKFEKSRLVVYVKVFELIIMSIGLYVLHLGHLTGLFVLLFLMGAHSTFFSPVKYGILPQALAKNQLVAANGLFEGSTFLFILIGTMYGGIFVLQDNGGIIVGLTCIGVAIAGLLASFLIPKAPGVDPKLALTKNFLAESFRVLNVAKQGNNMFLVLLVISWFWLLGAVILSLIPVYGAQILHGDEFTTTFLLSLFSVGIAIGSVGCQKLVKDQITLAYVPLAGILMTLFGAGMILLTNLVPTATSPELRTVTQLLAEPTFWPIILCFVGLSVAGGVFAVPLYAYMQAVGESATKSRLIAANNVLNAIAMVSGAIVSSLTMMAFGWGILDVLTLLMVGNLIVAIVACALLPRKSQQTIFQTIFRWAFGLKVINAHHLNNLPTRMVVISNHQSFLDAAIIAAFFPVKLTFAIDVNIAKKWWASMWFTLVKAFPMDSENPYAIRDLIKLSKTDEPVMVYPEGRLTTTGSLMKVYDGTAMLALNADATIVPVIIEGARFSKQTRLHNPLPRRWFPRITLTILPPQKLEVSEELRGRARRINAGQKLQAMLVQSWFAARPLEETLFTHLIRAGELYGKDVRILSDASNNAQQGTPLTYRSLIARSLLLADVLKRQKLLHTNQLNSIGLLLPNANAAAATFFALQAAHAVPAMLNFSAGNDAVLSACKTALLTHVITAHAFIEKAKLQGLIEHLEKNGLNIVYLEDIRTHITLADKLKLLLTSRYPRGYYQERNKEFSNPAVILFTSGSEGAPKGVVLSHSNINANVAQAQAVVDFNPKDTLLNALPMFHSFGLTGGTLLPVLSGVPTFLYPSPLHYRIVPEVAYNFNATIMFGTDTFLTGYARYAHPYDFYRMRYVFAGAEKVRPETRTAWMERFGIRILEGYGATETAPVLSLNTPLAYKAGSVGRLVPGMEYKLAPVPGVEGGNLNVRGPNVMLGYLKNDKPGVLQPPEDGWYETGDIVNIDDLGFITISGRLKRFAKIGGEMVSLTAAEGMASKCWPDSQHAVVSLPDDRKGEQLILFTTQSGATKDALRQFSRSHGGSELALPRHIFVVDKLLTLATGKTDYVSLTKDAEERIK